MDYGLKFVGDSPFVAILDDDDMWELTSLEKAALVMSWVPDAYAVSFDAVNHGNKEFLWKRGFYNGDESYFRDNNIMQGSPFWSSVLAKCHFREDIADGGADWDFWMCMASHGMWGLRHASADAASAGKAGAAARLGRPPLAQAAEPGAQGEEARGTSKAMSRLSFETWAHFGRVHLLGIFFQLDATGCNT